MARSTGPVLLAGTLAAANEAVLAPLAGHKSADWGAVFRLIPVTGGLALALAALEKAAPGFASGLAWLLVAGVILFPPAGGPSLISNANSALGITKGG